MQSEKYIEKSDKLIKQCQLMSRDISVEKSDILALKTAAMVMELEDFLDRHECFANLHKDSIQSLRHYVELLRPAKDQKKVEELKAQISNHFDNVPQEA